VSELLVGLERRGNVERLGLEADAQRRRRRLGRFGVDCGVARHRHVVIRDDDGEVLGHFVAVGQGASAILSLLRSGRLARRTRAAVAVNFARSSTSNRLRQAGTRSTRQSGAVISAKSRWSNTRPVWHPFDEALDRRRPPGGDLVGALA
jgi:hypothetical protein